MNGVMGGDGGSAGIGGGGVMLVGECWGWGLRLGYWLGGS